MSNDTSTDGSQKVLENLVATYPHVPVLLLSRNFGHQIAMTAGLDHALGDATTSRPPTNPSFFTTDLPSPKVT